MKSRAIAIDLALLTRAVELAMVGLLMTTMVVVVDPLLETIVLVVKTTAIVLHLHVVMITILEVITAVLPLVVSGLQWMTDIHPLVGLTVMIHMQHHHHVATMIPTPTVATTAHLELGLHPELTVVGGMRNVHVTDTLPLSIHLPM